MTPFGKKQTHERLREVVRVREVSLNDIGPKFEQHAAGSLVIDQEVQRPLTPSRARKIAREFDPTLVGVFLVSEREDGKKVLIDGQHRHAAINELGLGDMLVPCEVHRGLGLKQEAALFAGRNDAQKPNPFDRFDKGLLAQNPQCVRIAETLDRYGLRVARGKTTNGVCAVMALYSLDNYSGDVLDRTVRIIRFAWSLDPDAFDGHILRAVGLIIKKFDENVNDDRMIERLRKGIGEPTNLISMARKPARGRSKAHVMAEEIITQYNMRLSDRNKLGAI